MPTRTLSEQLTYDLICFDAKGIELPEKDGPLSDKVLRNLPDATDIFLMSHGWLADEPGAIRQYDSWTGAVQQLRDKKKFPAEFKPRIVGMHWPSLPYGSAKTGERLAGAGAGKQANLTGLTDEYTAVFGDSKEAKQAIDVLLRAAGREHQIHRLERVAGASGGKEFASMPTPIEPTNQVVEASEQLELLVGAPRGGLLALPPLIAEVAKSLGTEYADAIKDVISNVELWFLNFTSYYAMKSRAYAFGRTGAHELLAKMQEAAPKARFHLMGHSFGCIVISGALAGPDKNAHKLQAHSLVLAQGALSKWAYCAEIPEGSGVKADFARIIGEKRLSGPLVTTHSKHDLAVCISYLLATKLREPFAYPVGQLSAYQGLGAAGARGFGIPIVDLRMLPADTDYKFRDNIIYNIESSAYVCHGDLPSGAHCDIANEGVAHLVWQAAKYSMGA